MLATGSSFAGLGSGSSDPFCLSVALTSQNAVYVIVQTATSAQDRRFEAGESAGRWHRFVGCSRLGFGLSEAKNGSHAGGFSLESVGLA